MTRIHCGETRVKKCVIAIFAFLFLFASPSMASDPYEPIWVTKNPVLKTVMPGMTSLEWLALERNTNYKLWGRITGNTLMPALESTKYGMIAEGKFAEYISRMIHKHSDILSSHELTFNSATHMLNQIENRRVRFVFDPGLRSTITAQCESVLDHGKHHLKHIISFNPYQMKHTDLSFYLAAVAPPGPGFKLSLDRTILSHAIHEGTHMWTKDYRWKSLDGLGYVAQDKVNIFSTVSKASEEYNAQISGFLVEGANYKTAARLAEKNMELAYTHLNLNKIHESIDDSLLDAMVEYEDISGIPGKPKSSGFFSKLPVVGLVILGANYGSQAYAGEPIRARELIFDTASEVPIADNVSVIGSFVSVPIMRAYAYGLDKYYKPDRSARDYMATRYPYIPEWVKSGFGPLRVSPYILHQLRRGEGPIIDEGIY